MASDTLPPKPSRQKIALKPGFHMMDWMRLQSSFSEKGKCTRKISMAELAEHKSQFDCWTAYNGKVYNISQYLQYHPGGVQMLMSVAGKDCTKLYNKYHAWVNADSMLSKCIIGVLMSDELSIPEGEEEDEATSMKKALDEKELSATAIANLQLDDEDVVDKQIESAERSSSELGNILSGHAVALGHDNGVAVIQKVASTAQLGPTNEVLRSDQLASGDV